MIECYLNFNFPHLNFYFKNTYLTLQEKYFNMIPYTIIWEKT